MGSPASCWGLERSGFSSVNVPFPTAIDLTLTQLVGSVSAGTFNLESVHDPCPARHDRLLEPLIQTYPYGVKHIEISSISLGHGSALFLLRCLRRCFCFLCRSYSRDSEMASTLARDAPDTLAPRVNIVIWLLIGLSLVFLALRVFCKFKTHRGLWWDDHILIVSWVCAGSFIVPRYFFFSRAAI